MDAPFDEIVAAREKLVVELATTEAPVEDFHARIAKVRQQFNQGNIERNTRERLFLLRNNGEALAKRRLMPTVRTLIQTVVISKTSSHQPASLQVHDLRGRPIRSAGWSAALSL
jgi:hypothetical protein